MRLRSQFVSLDGSHPAPDPVPNTHLVSMRWTRLEADLIWKPDEPWDFELQVPYDIKVMRARYELPDGTPFDNPLGDLHHRDETLRGFGDLRILASRNAGEWRFSAGLSLPAGRIEPDPYELGDLGVRHQHILFGSGTFDPVLRVSWMHEFSPVVSADVAAAAHLPMYENAHGYRAPRQVDVLLGPRFALGGSVTFSAKYALMYQSRATWDGDTDPNTGYVYQSLAVSLPFRLGNGWRLVPAYTRTLDLRILGSGDTFDLEWIVAVTLEIPLTD